MIFSSEQVDSLAQRAGVDRADMEAALSERGHSIGDPVSRGAPAEASRAGVRPQPRNFNRAWVRTGLNAIPAVAGAAGGAMGAAGGSVLGMGVGGVPGAIGGAAAGGAGGEAVRQLVSRAIGFDAPDDPLEALGGIGIQAAEQGAMQAAGEGMALGLKPVARSLMSGALRVPAQMSQGWRTMRQGARPMIAAEVPLDVTESALQEGIKLKGLAGKDAYPGTTKTEKLVEQSAGENEGIRRWMQRSRSSKSPPLAANGPILDDVWALKKDLASSADALGDASKIDDFVEKFQGSRKDAKGKWKKLSVEEVNEIKQTAQRKAKEFYQRREKGALDENSSLQLRMQEALASGAQRVLEQEYDRLAQMLGKPAGELAASNARTGRMMRLGEAVEKREFAPPLQPQMHSLWGDLRSVIDNPAVRSRAALAVNSPGMRGAVTQTPRTLDFLIRSLFAAEPQGGQ